MSALDLAALAKHAEHACQDLGAGTMLVLGRDHASLPGGAFTSAGGVTVSLDPYQAQALWRAFALVMRAMQAPVPSSSSLEH